jgi:[glutamine synthetase] adenylyltransferase / [glutamine synthetase]-adenylyl-L-tyrosine phosphorylase
MIVKFMQNVTPPFSPSPPNEKAWDAALTLATQHAPFLATLIERAPFIKKLKSDGPEPLITALHADLVKLHRLTDTPKMMAKLRAAKADIALITALADLSGAWSVAKVTRTLSDFADATIEIALTHALKQHPAPTRQKQKSSATPLSCLALGKLGGRELNYSSDVDLIFFFDELGVAAEEEAGLRLSRVVHSLSRILQDATEDGYVFRVDLRLRPDPGATPPALSMAAAEIYYQSSALNWERAAYTRARTCAGNIIAGDAFLQRLSSWVWRRTLDFSALRDIDSLRDDILDYYDLTEFSAAGYDVKRGLGGIREIEFLMQIFQLIQGGRNPQLRSANTPQGLALLAGAGIIPHDDALKLTEHYNWLRTVEHRLQMQDDQQTHTLPKRDKERTEIALFCGTKSLDEFETLLRHHTMSVHSIYERLLGKKETLPTLTKKAPKIANSEPIFARWEAGRYRALTHPRARAALDKIKPSLIAAFSAAADPAAALARWDTLLSHLPAGVSFLEMFEANPKLLSLIAKILTLSESLGTQLSQNPHLLDAVLDSDFFDDISGPLKFQMPTNADTETTLLHLARWVSEQRFRQAVHILDALATPLASAEAHARTMDIAAHCVLDLSKYDLTLKYGTIPEGIFTIIALGAWGGKTLGPDSDLDALFIYSGSEQQQSTGPQKLSATHYYNRLGQKLISLMTSTTPSGCLAEIDMRLRPEGNKGLLVVSEDGFAAYQQKDAWVWEHMSLTRARCVTGDWELNNRCIIPLFEKMPNAQKIRSDILVMRADMDAHRPAKSIWDMKLGAGGLVDIEFIIQYLQLSHAHCHAAILTADVSAALMACRDAKLLTTRQADTLQASWTLYFNIRSLLKLCGDGDQTDEISKAVGSAIAQLTGDATLAKSRQRIAAHQKSVIAMWCEIFATPSRHTGETA